MKKIIEATIATGELVGRAQVQFDEVSGFIEAVGDLGQRPDVVFGEDCLLFAGMGDVHIHAREDVSGKHCYKEDYFSAFSAMVNGGVTHAGDMPNNPIPPVDDISYQNKFSLTGKTDHCIWIYAGIGPGTRPLSYPVPYKVYMGPSVGELFFKDLEQLDHTLRNYQGQVVSFHCEDPVTLEQNRDRPTHHERRPPEAEVIATKDALAMIEKYQLKGKLCHYSTSEGLQAIRAARARGVQVSIEVTPQHLFFDLEHLDAKDLGQFQMNPPIRPQKDRTELLRALRDGEIEFLATDHAPHTQAEKDLGTSGLTGLDTYAPFVAWLYHQGFDPRLLAKITAENPGDFYNQFLPTWQKLSKRNLGLGVGYLRPGFQANFTVLNLKREILITTENLRTKVKHSPFLGETLPGSLEALYIRGRRR